MFGRPMQKIRETPSPLWRQWLIVVTLRPLHYNRSSLTRRRSIIITAIHWWWFTFHSSWFTFRRLISVAYHCGHPVFSDSHISPILISTKHYYSYSLMIHISLIHISHLISASLWPSGFSDYSRFTDSHFYQNIVTAIHWFTFRWFTFHCLTRVPHCSLRHSLTHILLIHIFIKTSLQLFFDSLTFRRIHFPSCHHSSLVCFWFYPSYLYVLIPWCCLYGE